MPQSPAADAGAPLMGRGSGGREQSPHGVRRRGLRPGGASPRVGGGAKRIAGTDVRPDVWALALPNLNYCDVWHSLFGSELSNVAWHRHPF